MPELKVTLESPEPSSHHPGGPSSLGRISQCPASYLASVGCEKPQSDDADEGTMLHARIAMRISNKEGWDKGLTDEQIDTLDKCFEFYSDKAPDGENGEDGRRLYLEQTLGIKLPSIKVHDYGTMDVAIVWPDKGYGIVIDWKFGRGDLDTECGAPLQVGAYATMAMQRYELAKVDSYIFQPRVSDRPFHLEVDELAAEATAVVIEDALDAAGETDAPFHPGAEQCKYCPVKPTCGALKAQTMELVERRPQVPTVPAEVDLLYDKILAAEKFLKALKPDVQRAIKSGCTEKWSTAPRSGKRKVKDVKKLYQLLQKEIQSTAASNGASETPVDLFMGLCSCPLEGARKISGLQKKAFDALIEEAIERGDDYVAIVRAEKDAE